MSINDLPTGDDKHSGAFRRPGFIAAAAFLGLVLVLAVVVIATSGSDKGDSTTPQATGPTRPASSAPASSPADNGNTCGRTDTDQTVPTSTPPNIKWDLVKGDAVPTSPIAGPGRTEGPVARCYAHTPLGALLAASQIGNRLGVSSNKEAIEILKAQAVPGPGVERALKLLQGAELGNGKTEGHMAGFQFASYTADTAVINMVSRMTNGTFNTATFTMKWLDDDWKIQFQANGTASSTVSQVESTAGYVTWSGVS
ncbi:hypothetical protein [Streptomyces triculaminicus]|uniref:hypothetical protein n=1 Tax=Streptomyces triculaminicus TaxID=2816232 RepID=UPI0037D300C8